MTPTPPRHALMLQGPHGPFFAQLARALTAAGMAVTRVGFNRGDEMFWPDRARYIPFRGRPEDWPSTVARLIETRGITDLVLYGDTRPVHAQAVAAARARGVQVHVFEEGYLRPYWISYERGGANGHSALMQMDLPTILAAARALPETDPTPASAAATGPGADPPAPAVWGDMRQHVFWGALYHFLVMVANRPYRNFRPHRDIPVSAEFRLYLRRLALMPAHALERRLAERRIRAEGLRFHLVLLQLEHDASFRSHSPFASMRDFIALCIAGFAEGAPRDHHLVFKAHPLEDDRAALPRAIRAEAARHGLSARVHFVRGGKLAEMLDRTESVVTVNSTAGQQALWRGLALRIFGRAVYDKPGLVSQQPLPAFFAAPARPQIAACRAYRRFLLASSQVRGGFYSRAGRRAAIARLVPMMLAAEDPYDGVLTPHPRRESA